MSDRTDAQRRADLEYKRRAYDVITLTMPKGSREKLKAAASSEGMNVTRYILESVEQRSGLKLTLDGEFPAKKE